jgi:dienelactone hydrolase
MSTAADHLVHVTAGSIRLEGNLEIPDRANSIVVFAHGSGSSRHSPRNRFVAEELQHRGLATLLMDLLTTDEEAIDMHTRHLRFDIGLLANRLRQTANWLEQQADTRGMKLGFFGASTGAAAALVAASELGERASAVVSRGGRPDLAGAALEHVTAPTLLIIGGEDVPVISLNRQAYARLRCEKRLEIIPGATHLFEEPGTLEQVANLAGEWFEKCLE